MKKGWMYYFIGWTTMIVLFNIIAFVTPTSINGMSKFEGGFWPGYISIMISFVLHLINAKNFFSHKDKWERGTNTTGMIVSTVALIITIAIGGFCMVVPSMKDWIAIIVCSIVILISIAILIIIKGVMEYANKANQETERRKGNYGNFKM